MAEECILYDGLGSNDKIMALGGAQNLPQILFQISGHHSTHLVNLPDTKEFPRHDHNSSAQFTSDKQTEHPGQRQTEDKEDKHAEEVQKIKTSQI